LLGSLSQIAAIVEFCSPPSLQRPGFSVDTKLPIMAIRGRSGKAMPEHYASANGTKHNDTLHDALCMTVSRVKISGPQSVSLAAPKFHLAVFLWLVRTICSTLDDILTEMEVQVTCFDSQSKLIEARRFRQCTEFDLSML
jgi:hypothetical protein